jgi:hypothetical protein
VNEHEAWAIVAYLRVLQQSQRGTPEMLPRSQREALGLLPGDPVRPADSSVTDATTREASGPADLEGEASS